MEEKHHYVLIDYLRVFGSFGIILMHILHNGHYDLRNTHILKIVPSFYSFVYMFMSISALGLCIGYYDKIKNNVIDWVDFYKRRYYKIVPFFIVLVILDVFLSPSKEAIYEAFCEITMMFGFIPNMNRFSVMGVSWFLGLTFVFYMCFPFFYFIISDKKRAWITFIVSIILNYILRTYYGLEGYNLLFSSMFYILGGLIYIYKEKIKNVNPLVYLFITVVSICLYYRTSIIYLCVSIIFGLISLSLSLDKTIGLNNRSLEKIHKNTIFLSGLTMEIYLSHMAVFRGFEILDINFIFGYKWGQYLITSFFVFVGSIIFSYIVKVVIKYIMKKFKIGQGVMNI